ncbi:hypothetical protein TeGR_g5866, partial [Tetraparma gracilis]
MPRDYVQAEEQVGGGTMLNFVQSPYPPVTQILKNGQKDEWIGMQQDGLYVVNHAGEEEPWTPPSFSGYPSSGWGGDSGEGGILSELEGAIGAGGFRAISSSSGAGHRSGVHRDDDGTVHRDVPRSTISTGYTSFLFAGDMTLGDQMFFISSPDYLMYLLAGCPNYEETHTPEDAGSACPRREMKQGNFKFTVLGLMSGSDINSLNTEHPPLGGEWGDEAENVADYDKDIADYKTLIYRTMLDVGAMAGDTEAPEMWISDPETGANMTFAEIPQ